MGRFQLLHERLKALGHPVHSPLIFVHLDEAKRGKVTLNESDLADLEHLIESLVSELAQAK
jgi:hypothetical protein